MNHPGETPNQLNDWLELCGLDLPDSSPTLVRAVIADFERNPELRQMLDAPPETFHQWWHDQRTEGWQMSLATGSTDWAWLVLARAGAKVSDSRFGLL